jgi:hypothetical protein
MKLMQIYSDIDKLHHSGYINTDNLVTIEVEKVADGDGYVGKGLHLGSTVKVNLTGRCKTEEECLEIIRIKLQQLEN